MGMIGPRVPFGGSQGWDNTWNAVMGGRNSDGPLNFYGMDLVHPFRGSAAPGSSPAGSSASSNSGPRVAFGGNKGWESTWNMVMGDLLKFYDIDLEHPFRGASGANPFSGSLGAAPGGGENPAAFGMNA